MPATNTEPFCSLKVYVPVLIRMSRTHSPLRHLYPDTLVRLTIQRWPSPKKKMPYHPPYVPGEQSSSHASAAHNKSIDERLVMTVQLESDWEKTRQGEREMGLICRLYCKFRKHFCTLHFFLVFYFIHQIRYPSLIFCSSTAEETSKNSWYRGDTLLSFLPLFSHHFSFALYSV